MLPSVDCTTDELPAPASVTCWLSQSTACTVACIWTMESVGLVWASPDPARPREQTRTVTPTANARRTIIPPCNCATTTFRKRTTDLRRSPLYEDCEANNAHVARAPRSVDQFRQSSFDGAITEVWEPGARFASSTRDRHPTVSIAGDVRKVP